MVRLMTFIPGEIFVNVPYTPNLLYQAGRHVASIEKALMVGYLQDPYQSEMFTTWVFGANFSTEMNTSGNIFRLENWF